MPPKNEPTATPPVEPTGTPPVATPPKSELVATPPTTDIPDGMELIRTEDKNKLISQRDKAKSGQSDPQTTAVLSALMQKDAVREAMADEDFKSKYPDVTQSALLRMDPMDEDDIVAKAAELQADYERVKQTALKKVQVATAPTISASDRDAKMKELATPARRSRFQEALKTARMQVQ